ncbi:MAG: peptidase S9 [Pseudozobellia sp.]|nr:peptidase S9 [Pseudozobellia sp.]MBG46920.1 peptidase S9 [Pseudozobellia sp.]|tara:strand:+ start:988500 stop:989336 length:837 start_codon:yes stop_codon:yes gene_type:complete
MNKLQLLIVCAFFSSPMFGQREILYKQIDTVKLYLEIHSPVRMDKETQKPANVFFFGGGWQNGDRSHFAEQADYFSKRGLVCILADYRTESKHQTTPYVALQDAKSAMRYVRQNASKLGVDPNKIVASGGSAGGHLAAATSLIADYNDKNDDLSIDCKPNALLLFNPVIDNGPGGYGYERIGDNYKNFSPLHNIKRGAPPTLFLIGTEDRYIPVETAEYYQTVMEKVGSRCELRIYEGEKHGFFNYRFIDMFKETIHEADIFLQSLGYLNEEPKVEIN